MINLYISLYNSYRNKELLHCLNKNLKNKYIDQIFVLNEGLKLNNTDIVEVKINKKPIYNDFFKIINKFTSENDINIIANSDIYFDDSIKSVELIKNENCYALTRWNITKRGLSFENCIGSQDVWIFKGEIKNINGNIKLGVPGCDNRIAYEIAQAGYQLLNPSKEIIIYHYHYMQKTYNHNTEKIEPPYKFIPIISKLIDILHVSLGTHQKAQIKALKSIGDYNYFDWTKYNGNIEQKILELNQLHEPKLTFMQLQRPGLLSPEIAKRLTGKVINWTGDVRQPLPQWYIDIGKVIDISLFTNMNDVETMRRAGCKADYLQIGYDEQIYNAVGKKRECPSIVYLGNNYRCFPLSSERVEMVKLLKNKYGKNFGLYGNGWNGLEDGNFNNDEIAEAEILRSAKIVINHSNFNYTRYTSDRMFRAMGCNTFVLSHRYTDVEKEFKNNIHLRLYNNIGEIPKWIDYYLKEDDERKSIAYNGYLLCRNNYTWAHRIKELQKWI